MRKMLKATNEAVALQLSNTARRIEFEAYVDRDRSVTRAIPMFVAWKAFAKDTSLKAELRFFEENEGCLEGLGDLIKELREKSVKLSLETTENEQKLNYNEGPVFKHGDAISIVLANNAKVAKIVFEKDGAIDSLVTVDKQEFLTAMRELLKT